MRRAQKIIVAGWICVVVAMALLPPWTVRRTLHYRSGWEYAEFNTSTSFRWLFAEPEWEIYTSGMDDPISLKHRGNLRFDLLAVEIVAGSVVGFGAWILAGRRRRVFPLRVSGLN